MTDTKEYIFRYYTSPDYKRVLRRQFRRYIWSLYDGGVRCNDRPEQLIAQLRMWRGREHLLTRFHLSLLHHRLALALAARGTLQRPDAIPPGLAFRDWLAKELQKDQPYAQD